MKTTVLQGQSLADVSIQSAGSFEAVFAIAVANNISVTDTLTAGDILDTRQVVNPDILNYYTVRNITPATALVYDPNLQGIGYWKIEIDFIVS